MLYKVQAFHCVVFFPLIISSILTNDIRLHNEMFGFANDNRSVNRYQNLTIHVAVIFFLLFFIQTVIEIFMKKFHPIKSNK